MPLTYLVLHVQCGCDTGLSNYPRPSLLPPSLLRQVEHTNHSLSSLRLGDYCKSPLQQYVARQPAGNKNNVTYCICHFLHKSEHVYSYGVSPHDHYVVHTYQVLHVGNLHMSCNAHACRPVCSSHSISSTNTKLLLTRRYHVQNLGWTHTQVKFCT